MPKIPAPPPNPPAATSVALPSGGTRPPLTFVPDESLAKALTETPSEIREQMRAAAAKYRAAKDDETKAKATKASANKAFKEGLKVSSQHGLLSIPMDVDGELVFAYLREDETLEVSYPDLREYLIDWNRVHKSEDDDLAVLHAEEVLESVAKPRAIDNDKFKAAVTAKVIPTEVAAAASTLDHKNGYIAFEKLKA